MTKYKQSFEKCVSKIQKTQDALQISKGNYRNYVIDELTCEIMENKPLGSRMQFLWISQVVYFPVKHSRPYNKYMSFTLTY